MSSQNPTTQITDADGRVWKQCACGDAWFSADEGRTLCSECQDRAEHIEWVDVTEQYRHLFPSLTGRILVERAAISDPVTIVEEVHFLRD